MNKQRRRNVNGSCLGRVVNLFDFGTVGNGKKLLTEKPHFDDGSIKRNQIGDNVDGNGITMKTLLAEEMSKEMEFNLGSTNLVAKLMGLDSFPQPQPQRSSSNPRLKRSLSHGEYKEVYEVWQKPDEFSKMNMDIVREKFLEAKRLVTDDKLRHSKEFQDAMEVLSSNKELFLEFLQESNNFFSHHLHDTAPTTPEKSRHITILKPSKSTSEKSLHWPVQQEYPTMQSTRIVVLKPSGHVTNASSCPATNGYIGDDSSFNEYADSEVMSPVSRHSWDYINKFDSPFSSSFSRASGSPESSSVCREAKKRLSERWALMSASNENFHEAEVIIPEKCYNSTLGDLLALSDISKDIRTEEVEEEEVSDSNELEGSRVYGSCLTGDGNLKALKTLARSKSLPESSTSFARKSPDTKYNGPEELTKSKSLKWSLKGRVSNFLFSRNKKATKEKSDEESQVVNSETLDSRCNDDASVSARSINSREGGLSSARPTTFGNSSEWRDEPVLETSFDEDDGIFFNNPSSILNRQPYSSSLEPEMMSMRSNLIGKSPPIGSLGRTLSLDDSTIARCYSSKRSTTSVDPRNEVEDLRLLINTLLSAAGLDEESSSVSDNLFSKWHSAESPLDPSLRDNYADSMEMHRLGSNAKKLVFDLVNTLLLELTPSYLGPCGPMVHSNENLRVYLINRMQECLTGKGRVENRWWDEDGDLSSLAVNKVVRIEVAEIGSPDCLRLEMDSMGEELELKLLEELVEEVLMDLSEEPKLVITSIC